jgi:RNA recognition motif-containing protein
MNKFLYYLLIYWFFNYPNDWYYIGEDHGIDNIIQSIRNAKTDEQKEKIPDTPYYDRTLFISGLPQCTDREVQYSQENALREIFPELEAVSVPPNSDQAFVRFPSPSHVDSTIEEFEGEMQMAGEKGGIYVLKLSKLTDSTIVWRCHYTTAFLTKFYIEKKQLDYLMK